MAAFDAVKLYVLCSSCRLKDPYTLSAHAALNLSLPRRMTPLLLPPRFPANFVPTGSTSPLV